MLGYKLDRDNSEVWTLLGLNSSIESIDKHTPTLLRSRINTLRFFTSREATKNLPVDDEEAAPVVASGSSDREKLIEELHAEREANVKAAAEAAQEAEAAAWLEAKRTSEDGGEPGDTGPA